MSKFISLIGVALLLTSPISFGQNQSLNTAPYLTEHVKEENFPGFLTYLTNLEGVDFVEGDEILREYFGLIMASGVKQHESTIGQPDSIWQHVPKEYAGTPDKLGRLSLILNRHFRADGSVKRKITPLEFKATSWRIPVTEEAFDTLVELDNELQAINKLSLDSTDVSGFIAGVISKLDSLLGINQIRVVNPSEIDAISAWKVAQESGKFSPEQLQAIEEVANKSAAPTAAGLRQLQAIVGTQGDRLSKVEADVVELSGRTTAFESNLTALTNRTTALEESVKSLSGSVSGLAKAGLDRAKAVDGVLDVQAGQITVAANDRLEMRNELNDVILNNRATNQTLTGLIAVLVALAGLASLWLLGSMFFRKRKQGAVAKQTEQSLSDRTDRFGATA